ncbi:MAG TPA: hypothetical protein VH880_07595 [Anaeromyxobacteraceae bacterium]|jgi:hypothetical protein
MLIVFDVVVARGQDAEALLSGEVLRETGAQVLTLEQARARGLTAALPDPGGHEIRVVAVPQREMRFVQKRLEANEAVLSFTSHEVAG